jgi:predicted ATPase/class 3 adenylate cyclase
MTGNATPPIGVVTLVFTDIEGSTKLVHKLGDRFLEVLEQHRRVMRAVWQRHGGFERGTEGDSFFVIFASASDAVAAAVDAQRELAAQNWPEGASVRVRIGMHTGEPTMVDADYFGLDVHRAARISATGHGGQVVISAATRALAELPEGVTLRDLGEHRLKDLEQPEWLFQVAIDGLDADFPPLKSLETPTNLPVSVTSLVGREREMADIEALLGSDDVRSVTLTGPGGTGKTRLAIAVAQRMLETFRNGITFVDLAEVAGATDVPDAIERALELPNSSGVSPQQNIATALRDKKVLLVLDNFEHLTDAGGAVASILAGARGVKTIVTSRAPLRIAAEREYPLAPLPLPGTDASTDELASAGAVALFVDRARAVKPGFALTPSNAPVVADICRRLDGLPLAIELAAARIKLLTPDQILARLGSRLGLLTGGARDAPARQQTLRSTIAWSHDLLPPDAATLFRRAAVFHGGVSLDGLEFVSVDDMEALATIEFLLDQSLLRQDGSHEGRFFMLETIREYALERLAECGEAEAVHARHAEFFAGFAEEADAGLRGSDQHEWRKRLDAEQANLRAALLWTLDAQTGQRELGARIAAALGWYWYTHGRAVEGSSWLQKARAASTQGEPELRARLAQRLGMMLDQRAAKTEAIAVLTEAVDLFEAAGDRSGQARALNSLGSASRSVEPTARVRELFDRALKIRQEIGDDAGVASTTFNLGEIALDEGDAASARSLFERSREIDLARGDDWGAAVGSLGVGTAALETGDLESAATLLREAMRAFCETEDEDHIAEALSVFAAEAGAHGRAERSARLAGAADALWEKLGLPLAPADLAHVRQHQASARAALTEDTFGRAFNEGRTMTMTQAVAYALEERA